MLHFACFLQNDWKKFINKTAADRRQLNRYLRVGVDAECPHEGYVRQRLIGIVSPFLVVSVGGSHTSVHLARCLSPQK